MALGNNQDEVDPFVLSEDGSYAVTLRCEWCNAPMSNFDIKGVLLKGSVLHCVGYCRKCRAELWTEKVNFPLRKHEVCDATRRSLTE